MALKSTGVRLEGTREQIQEAVRRLLHVFHVSSSSKLYDSRSDPAVKFAYLRLYTYEPDTLLDQLKAAHADIDQLHQQLGEALLKVERLKAELDLLPDPGKYDAVLSPRSKGARNLSSPDC